MGEFRVKLEALEDQILTVVGQTIVAGDFNARALEWGMPSPDSRGRLILEMVARTGLLVLNIGTTTNFHRPGYTETIPDITFASEGLVAHVRGWKVMEDYSGSDHQYITFEVGPKLNSSLNEKPSRWNLDRLNRIRFTEELAKGVRYSVEGSKREAVEGLVSSTMERITSACEASMPRKKPRYCKAPVYWWTAEIAELRKSCNMLRRRAQRAKSRAEASKISADHKTMRRQLRHTINQSKANCWKKLVQDIDKDPWGLGYKIVTQKLGAQKPMRVMDRTTTEGIVRTLFPSHPERPVERFGPEVDVPMFTQEELKKAVLSMKEKKAPGPDGIPSEVLKIVFHQDPNLLLRMYNESLQAGVFSTRWKKARLVLISKPKGDPELPSSYRPLCMLDTAGKVLEKLIRARLQTAIQAAGNLASNQYAYRAGLSTIDAIQEVKEAVRRAESHNHFSRRIVLLVTLDVKNAFNSARWCDILNALEHEFHIPTYLRRIISDYLRDRTLLYDTEEGQSRMVVTAGVAQGSILGPDLWNAFYDSLLRTEMPEETNIVGYADDVAILIAGRDTKQAQIKLNIAMRKINRWMEVRGLTLALNKTEMTILTKRKIQPALPMWIGEEVINTKPVVKYLGIMIDSKMTFFEQIRRTADKAAKGVMALSRLMANIGGPKSSKRRLLMSAVQSVLLYGAEVWADSLKKDMYKKRLSQVQRRGALRVASAYRTVSEAAIMVIARCIPIQLLANERKTIYTMKTSIGRDIACIEERSRTLESWQIAWDEETTGRWTAKLIKKVSPWYAREHGEVNYYLTQFLSGHGYFMKYLYKMGKATSHECIYCNTVIDDAEHTFFSCDNWLQERKTLEEDVGGWSPSTAVDIMLQDEHRWNKVEVYVEGILKAKKLDLDRII